MPTDDKKYGPGPGEIDRRAHPVTGADAEVRAAEADLRDVVADARAVAADAREADADAHEVEVDAMVRDADERTVDAELRVAEANVHLQVAKEHLAAAEAQAAAADHRSDEAERLIEFADEQIVGAAAKLAEATSDSEAYQRALVDYTTLVRHRMANPLQAIVGAAATLKARPDLPDEQRLALVDAIVKQSAVLERICLAPKVLHASEYALEPTPDV